MGSSRSAAELAGKIDRFTSRLSDTTPGLTAVGVAGKATFLGAAGGSIGVHPVGKRKKIGARYDVRGTGFKASVAVTYTGPAHLVNNPTKPHYIAARRLGRARGRGDRAFAASAQRFASGSGRGALGGFNGGRGAKALTIGPNLRPYAFHPGTSGKGFARPAKAAVAKQSPAVYTRAGITGPLKGVFR